MFSQVNIVNESISTVDENALIVNGKYSSGINGRTFQKDALISHKGYQYIVHYNDERRVCISRRKLPNGKWNTITFLDYYFKSNDSHNCISMGICPNDGTIHLAFDHHVDTLHYRVSKKGLAMPSSPVRKLVPFAEAALKKGRTIYQLNIGQPDIKTPEIALQAVKDNDIDILAYSNSKGEESYRKKLVSYYHKNDIK